MKIEIWILTKIGKNWWGEEQLLTYLKRISRWKIEIREFKIPPKEPPDSYILLDEKGKELTSIQFARKFEKWETEKQKIILVIGGPYGVNEKWKSNAEEIIALSKMTIQHHMALLFLTEQIYRAFTIISGYPYHH